MCLKHKENPYILHAFLVLDGACGWWNREFLNRPLDTSIVRFCFGVQRSDYNFNFEVSRGPFSISTLRCPEVTTTSEVSRGTFREILNGPLDTEGFKMTRRDPSWRSGNTGIPQCYWEVFLNVWNIRRRNLKCPEVPAEEVPNGPLDTESWFRSLGSSALSCHFFPLPSSALSSHFFPLRIRSLRNQMF